MPLHCGNWRFGGAQERKGSVDNCIIRKRYEQVIFSVADKYKEDDLTHIMYLIYSGRCQYFRYLRYPMNASSSKYLFCARSAQGEKRITNLVDVVRNRILMEQVNSSEKGTTMKGEAHIKVRLRFKQYH